jgi:hypothetical protein
MQRSGGNEFWQTVNAISEANIVSQGRPDGCQTLIILASQDERIRCAKLVNGSLPRRPVPIMFTMLVIPLADCHDAVERNLGGYNQFPH